MRTNHKYCVEKNILQKSDRKNTGLNKPNKFQDLIWATVSKTFIMEQTLFHMLKLGECFFCSFLKGFIGFLNFIYTNIIHVQYILVLFSNLLLGSGGVNIHNLSHLGENTEQNKISKVSLCYHLNVVQI